MARIPIEGVLAFARVDRPCLKKQLQATARRVQMQERAVWSVVLRLSVAHGFTPNDVLTARLLKRPVGVPRYLAGPVRVRVLQYSHNRNSRSLLDAALAGRV